jgi:hypothetical protein
MPDGAAFHLQRAPSNPNGTGEKGENVSPTCLSGVYLCLQFGGSQSRRSDLMSRRWNMSSTKRYQIFVSSTHADLKEEREAVINELTKVGYIAVGMEQFPATDEE